MTPDPDPLVNQVMNHHVVCVDHDLPALHLALLFDDEGVESVPVLNDQGEPQGIVSRAALRAWGFLGSARKSPAQMPTEAKLVADEIMQTRVFVLLESAPLSRAAALLAYERTECLVIISQHGKIVGTLAPEDIARWVALRGGFVIPPHHRAQMD
jgi:CBS-domain-containing membrane protein